MAHCPDPSIHSRNVPLDDASRAAAFVTHPEKAPSPTPVTASKETSVLGPDGRLSSAGAATSLKYAREQDLPSFPSVGIDTESSGNTAANLATSNQKPFEHWRPETSHSASQAALLAAREGSKFDTWQHKTSNTGYSAAGYAMGKQRGSSPQTQPMGTSDTRQKALQAASKSVTGRDRSSSSPSTPKLYPDAENSAFNALNAATVANKPRTSGTADPSTVSAAAMEAARVQNLHSVPKEMYTEHPPVAMEVEERKRKAALRASAISMAKSMYESQQRQSEESSRSAGLIAAGKVHNNPSEASQTTEDIRAQAMTYLHVQEAAQKLAAERLAKLDPDGVLAYREHYGYTQTPPRSKISIRGRNRPRSSSEGQESDSDDEVRAGRIRTQMSQFNDQVAAVDARKRTKDRENLMAAAERAVHARMHDMDEKVFTDTGKVPPSLMEEWEASARAKAAAESEERMRTHGKVHIGGGRYMDQAEIDAIAAGRMKPTLDEISDTAERQRARDEEIRLDIEQRKREAELERQREKEVKAELKRIKEQEKADERREREAEKRRVAEEKLLRDFEKKQAKEDAKGVGVGAAVVVTENQDKEIAAVKDEDPGTTGSYEQTTATDEGEIEHEASSKIESPTEAIEPASEAVIVTKEPADLEARAASPPSGAIADEQRDLTSSASGKDKSKRDSKIRGLFNKFKRSSKVPETEGRAVTSASPAAESEESKEIAAPPSEPSAVEPPEVEHEPKSPSISSPSTSDAEEASPTAVENSQVSNDSFEEARDQFDDKLSPPRASYNEESPVRTSSKFQEEL